MNCVNKSSKEFKSLASRNNISDNALELIVHKYWREKGNENYFPSDSYVQAQLGAIPYEETGKSVKKLWNKKYSSPQFYDTFEKLQSAIVEAQRYFPNEAIVHYQNADGKYVLAIRQPVRSFYKALDEAEAKGSFETPVIPLEVEEGKEYTLETAQNLFEKFNKDRTSKPLANKVFKTAKDLGIKIYFNNILSDGNVGAYHDNNSITFYKAYFERGTDNDKKAEVILHEVIHALTNYALSDDITDKPKALQDFKSDIEQLFKELQYNPMLKGEYGVSNIRDFVAELANPIFRQKIQAIDNNRKQSFWQRIIDAFKKLLGIHSSSPYYTRMMNTLDKALNAFDVKTYMEYNGITEFLRNRQLNQKSDVNNINNKTEEQYGKAEWQRGLLAGGQILSEALKRGIGADSQRYRKNEGKATESSNVREGMHEETDYDTLSTDDLKNELHNYVNTKLADKVKSTDALNSFINSLPKEELSNIYDEVLRNYDDTQFIVNKLRQLAKSKQNKNTLAVEHSNIDNAQKQSSMSVSGLFDNVSVASSEPTPSPTTHTKPTSPTSENTVPASYEGMITPDTNTVFVFGSNPEGRHGAGAAKTAKEKFGAIYGQGEGLQGNSYALPTKDLRVKENNSYKSISPEQITESIKKMYEVARQHPDKQFKVAYTNGLNQATLNGYTGAEMIKMFKDAGPIPSNVVFSKNWTNHWKEVKATKPIASMTSIASIAPKDYITPQLIEHMKSIGIDVNDKAAIEKYIKEHPQWASEIQQAVNDIFGIDKDYLNSEYINEIPELQKVVKYRDYNKAGTDAVVLDSDPQTIYLIDHSNQNEFEIHKKEGRHGLGIRKVYKLQDLTENDVREIIRNISPSYEYSPKRVFHALQTIGLEKGYLLGIDLDAELKGIIDSYVILYGKDRRKWPTGGYGSGRYYNNVRKNGSKDKGLHGQKEESWFSRDLVSSIVPMPKEYLELQQAQNEYDNTIKELVETEKVLHSKSYESTQETSDGSINIKQYEDQRDDNSIHISSGRNIFDSVSSSIEANINRNSIGGSLIFPSENALNKESNFVRLDNPIKSNYAGILKTVLNYFIKNGKNRPLSEWQLYTSDNTNYKSKIDTLSKILGINVSPYFQFEAKEVTREGLSGSQKEIFERVVVDAEGLLKALPTLQSTKQFSEIEKALEVSNADKTNYQLKLNALHNKYRTLDKQREKQWNKIQELKDNIRRKEVEESDLPFFKTPSGEVYGFVTPDGKMFLDETKINPEHPIHEYTHLWDRALMRINPQLWNRGIELMRKTSLWKTIEEDANYGALWKAQGLSQEEIDNRIASEVHARFVGEGGAKLLENLAKEKGQEGIIAKLKDWILEAWKSLKATFSNWSEDEINKLTLKDFNHMTMRDFAEGINPNTINPVQQVLSDKSTNMQTTLSLPNFEHFVYDRAADKLEGIKVDAPWKEQYLKDLDSQFRRMEDEDEEKYHMSDADKQYNQTLIDKMKVILNAKDKDDYLNDKQRDYKEKLQSALSDYDKLNQQYANLLNGMTDKDGAKWCDSPFTVSEIRHVAELVMDSISDTITDIQTQDGLAEQLFPNIKPEEGFDFKKASREDIIGTIGIENLLANAKKTFDTEHNNWFEDNCDENYGDATYKADFIYNNWDAIVKMGADIFAFNEGIGISRNYGEHKFNTTKETQPLTDDFNNDLDEDSLNEKEGDAQEHWQVNFRTIDTMNSMSALIRQAIHECYDLDENGQPKVHPLFGLKERVDERKVTNNILNWVQGARTIDEMVDKLSAQQKNNRWLSQLITRLQDKSGANADFQSQFFGVFCKHFQLYSIVIDQNGKYTCINANAHPALTEIMNGIKGKYHLGEHPLFTSEGKVNRQLLGNDKTVDDSNPFNLKQAFKHLPEWDFGGNHKEIDMSPEKMEEYAEWLTKVTKALGYDVNQELIADILNEKSLATMVEKLHFIVQDLEGAVKMEDNGEKYDPFKYKGDHSINSAIQNFMSPIAAVLEDSVTNSFFDSGKMYQSFVIPSFTTKLFQNLTQTSDEEFNKFMMEEYGKSEWFRGKEVFNRQTKKMEVQWNVPWLKWMKANRKSLSHRVQLNFNGHNYMKNLTDPEYALSVLAEYNSEADNTAWFRIPMESNKPSEEFIKFLAYKNEGYKKEIVEDLSDMVFMEISRIQTVLRRNLSKGDKGFIKNFDTNGRQFCFFPFLNDYITENGKGTILKDAEGNVSKDNKVLAELLQKKIKGEEELSADEEVQLRKLIKDTTTAYMQKRADNILDMMKQKGIVRASYKIKNMVDDKYIKPKDATGKSLEGEELEKYYDNVTDKVAEQAIENFLWNDYLASKNILMIMVGDTAFYKDAEDLQKRLAELHAPGIRGNINATDYEGKKVSADGKYRTVILKDFDSFKSNIIANLNEVFDRKIAQAPEHEKAAWKALKEDILKAYSEVNVADAEGYSSMTSYRKKALMFGKWGKDAEEIYKKVLAGNYTYTELKTAFQPMKPFVYTHLEKNMGVENAPIHMMYSPFQAKNSEVLLVMADALLMHENTSRPNILRAIDNIMEDSAYDGRERDVATGKITKQGTYNGKGIDTIQFESAIKSSLQGAIDLNGFLNDKNGGEAAAYAYLKNHIYKEGTNDYDVDNYVHETSFADYCIQQEIPEHFKNHSQAHGSQTRMIIPSDLDEYYDYSKDHNDPDNIVKYEWTDDNGVKHSLDANEFRNHYESTIADNILDSLDKLALEFHLTDSEGNPVENKKERNIALSQILVNEIDSSPRYGIDLRWACSLDENGEFNIPLGDPIQCKRIEQLINSIIKNRVNKQEIPGGPIVQVSNFGTSRQLHIRFNDKNGNLMSTEEEFNKAKEEGTLTDEQKKYSSYKDYIHENQGGIAYFEVFAPIWSDEIAEKFMDENGNIDIKAIEETNPEMLKLITYRIPTEDKYSMAPCKIVGFMPREAGDTIMLPYELTTIDGSDFDIDKRYVMRKDYRIIESKRKVGKYLYKKAEELIVNEKKAPLTHDDKQTLHDKVDTFLDIINRLDADKILNGRLDKELRKLYQEIHNDKNIMKHCYTTAPVDKNSKQFNDNEIVNMSWAVLTNPTSADKMLNPGGFELQKKVGYMVAAYKNPANADVSWNNLHAMKVDELKKLSYTQKDLAWFDTQMQFYKQNSAAATLIGIFAVNKIAHAVLEANDFYVDIPEICGSDFAIGDTEFKDRMKVDPRYDTNGSIIGKVLGSLVGASADAVKDPVLNLMNINITTAGMLNTMVRLGVPFEDAALFLSQDIVTRVIDEYNKRNLSNYASIDDVINDFMEDIEKRTGLSKDGTISEEGITKEELVDGLRECKHDKADYKVLLTFTKLKALTDKMRNITFATRFNSISSAVGPLIVDNLIMEHKIGNFLTRKNDSLSFIKPQNEITVPHEDGSETTEQAPTGFYTKDGIVVDINDVWEAHPILEAFKDTVKIAHQAFEAANMPTNSVKFRTILATLEKYGLTEKVFSDKKLLDQLSTFYQSYMLMASGLIDSKNLSYYINDFPKKFLEYQKDDKYSGNALIQTIKLNYSRQTNKPFLQIKITGMDAKEKEELSSAWVDLYKQDQKLATALFQYSFFRAGIGFSPKTFMALVPVYIKSHLSKTMNGETVTYKDVYKGKYNDQIVDDNVIDQFVRNNWDNNKLVPWVNPKKNHLSISYNSKTMTAYDKEGRSALAGKMYVKTSSKGTTYLWKKRGVLFDPEEKSLIYNMVAPLGNNGEYLEISTNEINRALTDTKKPAEKDNQADLDIESSTTTDNSVSSTTTVDTKAEEKKEEKNSISLREMFINFNPTLANDHRAENLIESYKKNPEKYVGILQKIFKANGFDLNVEKTIKMFNEKC